MIATDPVARRPDRIGGNIVWDVRERMYAQLREHRGWQGQLSLGERPRALPGAPGADPAEQVEVGQLLRWAVRR